MQKADLKSLVTQMYEELLQKIDENDGVSKKKVVEYLNNSAITINSIDDTKIDSSKQAKDLFLNTYKDIAKKSLNSYENTSEKFEQLSQVHQQALSGYKNSHTDFPAIKDKFHEIQIDMNQEILKANATISKLTKQIQELEESSNLDSLTKVFNRRALTSYLSRVCEKGNIHSNLHLLILDIDDFKQINDTHGHIAGDKILIFIANILRHTLRDGDKVFRYGGEEFIITLNRIDKSKCKDVGKTNLTSYQQK